MDPRRSKPRFLAEIEPAKKRKKPIILDGAVGTELDNRGMETGSSLWSGLASLEHPDLLEAIHSDYVAAGAGLVTTATFRTTRRAFARENQPENRWRDAARRAVKIARKSAGTTAIVAGSVAPLEDCFSPGLAPFGRGAEQEHALLCNELVSAGVDVLWLETFGTLGEISAAASSARRAGEPEGVPFSVSVTTNKTGDLISGEPIIEAFKIARDQGAVAYCVNCVPPAHVDAALKRLLGRVDLPIGVYANLGFTEENQDWSGSAALSPEEYAELAGKWVEAGILLIGGCCGSSPAHIRALSSFFQLGF
jgi:S-methylmethionine-dependent homocysteine/selenocysteine methylase